MRHGIVGFGFQGRLKGLNGVLGPVLAVQNLPAKEQAIHVLGVLFQHLVAEATGFLQTVFHDEQLGIVLLHHVVLGMFPVERGVFRGRLIQVAEGQVELPEQAVPFRLVAQGLLGLDEHLLGLSFLPLCQVEAR